MKVLLMIFLISNYSLAFSHEHSKAHDEIHEVHTPKTGKFKTTPELKSRMDDISSYMDIIKSKKDSSFFIKKAGGKITSVVNDIIKTCKLPHDADEAVHPELGLLLSGASDLKEFKYEDGYKKINQALINYGKLFEHEGWKHK